MDPSKQEQETNAAPPRRSSQLLQTFCPEYAKKVDQKADQKAANDEERAPAKNSPVK